MISSDEMLRELLKTFQVEAAEHLQTLNTTLLALEVRPDEAHRRELVREAFRAAHSLKGAARAVSLDSIEQLANGMESVLQEARDKEIHLKASAYDVLYDVLDTIGLLLKGESAAIEPLLARLARLTAVESAPLTQTDVRPVEKTETPQEEAPKPFVTTPEPVSSSPSVSSVDDAKVVSHIASGDETIRVAISKLDNLMAQVDELLVSKMNAEQRVDDMQRLKLQFAIWPKLWQDIKSLLSALDDNGKGISDLLAYYQEQFQAATQEMSRFQQHLRQDTQRLGVIASQLQDHVRHVRMVPFETLVPGLQRTVRDAAHSENKEVIFQVTGGEVELDKRVLEALKDPFVHLLRNAVSHGIENPDVRKSRGKASKGCIELSLQQRGAEVRISVRDDGAGFDLKALREAGSKQRGENFEDASDHDLIELAFQPGVTTSEQVTALSGRGIGLDVVRQQLEALQGYIEVESDNGKGSIIHLVVPATLSISRGLLVQAGNESYVLPLLSVVKIVQPRQTFTLEGQTMLSVDGSKLPIASLSDLLKRPALTKEADSSLAVILAVAEQRLALLVDDVLTEQELAVKPLGKPLHHVRNIAGVALMGDGKPIVILNTTDLVRASKDGRRATVRSTEPLINEAKPRILVVDDSITTRTLEKHILETAGYEVTTATDGQQALERLKETPVDLVVSDVQMPNMDGIAFTRFLRADNEFKDMPLILVTSLESSEDREQGMEAGANAYIVKRGFDQEVLLNMVRQLICNEEGGS